MTERVWSASPIRRSGLPRTPRRQPSTRVLHRATGKAGGLLDRPGTRRVCCSFCLGIDNLIFAATIYDVLVNPGLAISRRSS